MENKYTIEDYPTGGLYITRGRGAVIIMDKASYDNGTMERDEFLCLRSLLQAAPKLLEALQNLVREAKGNNEYECDRSLQHAVENAEYIIAKAKGGSEQ